jgi:hypothetical protein
MTATDPIELAPGTLARTVPGEPFAMQPALRLDSLALYLPTDKDQPSEARLAATTGSSEWLWNGAEDWRFDRTSSQLVRIIAALPADNAPKLDPEVWTEAPTVTGTIELATPGDFARPEGTTRWIDPTGTTLILGYEPMEPALPPLDRRRVRLADGCYLLIHGDRVAGWQLERPVRFISGDSGGAPLPGAEMEAELGRLFSDLIAFTDDVRLNALDRGDLTVREDLLDLDQRLEPYCARHDSRALEMRMLTRQVLENFGPPTNKSV